jgi:2',3'-cyclic-nucleotide 2'-phosphodiesterase
MLDKEQQDIAAPTPQAPLLSARQPIALTLPEWREEQIAADPNTPIGILMIGDIVGRPGRETIAALLPDLRKEFGVDLVVANIENLAHGFGITPDTVADLERTGVDLFTGGNHTWKNAAGFQWLTNEEPPHVVRPANIVAERPGADHAVVELPHCDKPVILLNLLGEVFMKDPVHSLYQTFDSLYALYGSDALYIVDLHAEATGEKRILGWHTDGRASIIVGTHTHIPTADEIIQPQGTAYISDLGFTGAVDSSLGMRTDLVMRKVVYKEDVSLEPPEHANAGVLHGLFVQLNRQTGAVTRIERLKKIANLS